MNKIIIVIVFLIVPFTMSAQIEKAEIKKDTNTIIKTEVVIKKVEPISTNPKLQNKTINFKKSNDFISVKAYIKSLRMKRKETLMS